MIEEPEKTDELPEDDLVIEGDDTPEVETPEEEPVVSFGDEEEEDDTAPDLPKRLRNEIKDRDRELAILRRERDELATKTAPKPIEVGEKPTREEYDWDEDAYDAAVDAYNERRIQAAVQGKQSEGVEDEVQQSVKLKVDTYEAALKTLPYADAEVITKQARDALTPAQHFNIVSATKDSATFLYALGKNPAKLQALANIKNPAEQIAEAARMELSMKTGKTKAPAPDTPLNGNKSAASGDDKEGARLKKAAEASGDYSAYYAHKRARNAA